MANAGARRRRLLLAATLGAFATGLVLFLADVDTALTPEDRGAIATLGLDAACGRRSSYEDDLRCIGALQARIAEVAPDLHCVHRWGGVSHEPAAFLGRRTGCCYDRSRLIEKTLALYGFEVRHLSLHNLRIPPPFGYLQSTPSHSISEARTRRGWMVVDSNDPFTARDANGAPLDARALRDALRSGMPLADPAPGNYFGGDYAVFYGLYSRHGGFYRPFAPVPDIDLAQLRYNLE